MSTAFDKSSERQGPAAPADAAGPDENIAAPNAVTLVPNSLVQFFDFRISEVDAARVRRRFFEDAGEDDESGPQLHAVALNDDVVHHPLTGERVDAADTYAIDGAQALAPFLDTWVPIPYLRDGGTDEEGLAVLGDGPTNWARAFITRAGDRDDRRSGYKVVLAIDTAIDTRPGLQSRVYAGPTLDDVQTQASYVFSDDESNIGGFVSEIWIDDWVAALYREYMRRESQSAGEEEWTSDTSLDHLAHYLTLLTVLARSVAMPSFRFADLSGNQQGWNAPGVELVLDMGSSRTTALLQERAAPGSSEGSRVSLLPLRDLSEPWRIHAEIFSSRLQFARAELGNEVWSRWSGRTNAFYWPSLARAGSEAERLAAEQPSSEDWSGLSSPMHYIWDDTPSPVAWRFSKTGTNGAGRGALLSGLMLAHVTEDGDVIDGEEKRTAATKPRFSRSSLTTFFAVELITQALSAINSPHWRTDGRPRVLQRILLTTPSNLSPFEQQILKRRVEGAVQLVWQSLGSGEGSGFAIPRAPEVRIISDNASSAGLAYLHNELGYKFNGKVREYFDLMGKQRPEHRSGRSLRVASLDIGGSASCLSVATYESADGGSISQALNVLDGCSTGTGDILKAIIERHVMPALERRLLDCKLTNAKRFLERVINGQGGRRQRWSGEFGRRFASEIARPLAIAMLETHFGSRIQDGDAPVERTLGALLSLHSSDAKAVLDELDELASDEGADTFSPNETLISFRDRDIAFTIRTVLEPVLANVSRIVHALDCDVLLVSGWAARLPAVMDMLVERMPSQPNRIVPLSDYRVADWYVLRGRSGTIGDAKSAAAMGAALAGSGTIAGSLQISLRPIEPEAARLHVGRMSERGLVANDTLMFVLGESASAKETAGKEGRSCTLAIEPPVLLGVRRVALESWPATPLYWLDHEPPDQKARKRGPLKVTVERVPGERGMPETLRVVRACDADGNIIAPSEMAFRIQSLKSPKGHWLDTGAIVIE